jgi:hypothetical protein
MCGDDEATNLVYFPDECTLGNDHAGLFKYTQPSEEPHGEPLTASEQNAEARGG